MKPNEIYLAIQNSAQRSLAVDNLVLDGFDISPFQSATALWEKFQIRPVRFIITERKFSDGFTGVDLCQKVRKDFLLPYVFMVMLSSMSQLNEIKEGLAAGVDDYLVKPPNPCQLRSRALIGFRWLQYIDAINAVTPKKPQIKAA